MTPQINPTRPIRRLLVANRAEIASRIFRTAAEMGIETVAIYSQVDSDLPYVLEADRAIALKGNTPRDSYLNLDQLGEVIEKSGADAVHPGYGFLSENSQFAQMVQDMGVVFVGPAPSTIEIMGSKTKAKSIMESAGVAVLPQIVIEQDLDEKHLMEMIRSVPGLQLPLLVKASYGGGGRGMRIIDELHDLYANVALAQREADSAFGNAAVFIEPYIQNSRHIEVQILADSHGDVVHLFERECSIQRRYQKIIEETPSPYLDDEQRQRLYSSAIKAAKAVDYVNAGTVEFIFRQNGDFYFLEMNTRLQVEHPITELITGVDIVKEQLQIAAGESLSQELHSLDPRGSAIEVRVYAEDPSNGYAPQAGTLSVFNLPSTTVRIDTGYAANSEVSSYYDAMLAKISCLRKDRNEAARVLSKALGTCVVVGVPTNIPLLRSILEEDEFLEGKTDTDYLVRHKTTQLMQAYEKDGPAREVFVAALSLYRQHLRSTHRTTHPRVPPRWRNLESLPEIENYEINETKYQVKYKLWPKLHLSINDQEILELTLLSVATNTVTLQVDGQRHCVGIHCFGPNNFVLYSNGHQVTIKVEPKLPDPAEHVLKGSLLAPMPGLVVSIWVKEGDSIEAKEDMMAIEAMKMQHSIKASQSGIVAEVLVKVGMQVTAGQTLAVIAENSEPQSS